jgi:hypothetical protein
MAQTKLSRIENIAGDLSSSEQKYDRDECLKYSFVKDYFVKPINEDTVEFLKKAVSEAKNSLS